MNKKISYVTLVSDLYLLLSFSYIIYGIFFGFDRIGNSSFTVMTISKNIAIIICVLEIIFGLIMAYLLHKCSYKKIRILLMVLCLLNIIYRVVNILFIINPFTIFMIVISVVLFIILMLY